MTTTRTLAVDAIAHHHAAALADGGDMPTVADAVVEVVATIDAWLETYTDDPANVAGVLDLRAELMRMRYTPPAVHGYEVEHEVMVDARYWDTIERIAAPIPADFY